MSAVNLVLTWWRASPSTEELLLRRLDGIRGQGLDFAAPKVSVFSRPKKLKAA